MRLDLSVLLAACLVGCNGDKPGSDSTTVTGVSATGSGTGSGTGMATGTGTGSGTGAASGTGTGSGTGAGTGSGTGTGASGGTGSGTGSATGSATGTSSGTGTGTGGTASGTSGTTVGTGTGTGAGTGSGSGGTVGTTTGTGTGTGAITTGTGTGAGTGTGSGGTSSVTGTGTGVGTSTGAGTGTGTGIGTVGTSTGTGAGTGTGTGAVAQDCSTVECATGYECQMCLTGTATVEPICIPEGVACGRPLVIQGTARLAGVVRGAHWRIAQPSPDLAHLDETTRHALAHYWTRKGLEEHASIASFRAFARDLRRLGAPDRLVQRALEAAEDEGDHARRTFTLASALHGAEVDPEELDEAPAPAEDLVALALENLRHGCINETVSTALAIAQLEAATDPAVRSVLEAVVRDETRHAQLAWECLAWALEAGGEPVRHALLDALARMERPNLVEDHLPVPELGMLDAATQAQVVEAAWHRVILPVTRALQLRT